MHKPKLLNNKISLKGFNIFFFVSIFILIISGLYYQYHSSNKITQTNFQTRKYNKSLEIREKFRTLFDKIEFQFIKAEAENKKKLDLFYQLYQDNNLNITEIANELNKDVTFGHYQVSLINKNYILEQTSFKKETGLDFKNFEPIKKLFDKIFSKRVEIDISSPKLDLESHLKRYLIKLSHDQKYILQIGFSFDYNEEISKQLTYLNSNKSTTSLYLATEYFIQDISIKSKIFDSKEHQLQYLKQLTKTFLTEINQAFHNKRLVNLSQKDTRKLNLNKTLETLIPLNKELISVINKEQDTLSFYSSSGSLFGENSSTILFIKTTFPLQPLNVNLRENLNTFLLTSVLVLLILSLFEYFKNKQITLKVASITENIKNNKLIKNESSTITDINVLIDSYNEMLNKLNKQIQVNKNLSYIDSLTSVKNRKAYDEKIQELVALYKRHETTFSIAILDADDFKNINDSYGHSFGDTVLKELAKAIKANIRDVDMLFRVGGEEFIIIFPNTNLLASKIAINKVRQAVDTELHFRNNCKVTLSIGLAEICKYDDKDSIFKKIDRLLYTSKNTGKNKVTST